MATMTETSYADTLTDRGALAKTLDEHRKAIVQLEESYGRIGEDVQKRIRQATAGMGAAGSAEANPAGPVFNNTEEARAFGLLVISQTADKPEIR